MNKNTAALAAIALAIPALMPHASAENLITGLDWKRRSRSHGGRTKACVRDHDDLAKRRKRQRDARKKARR